MDLSQILNTQAVRVISSVSSKKRLLNKIGDIAQEAYGLNSDDVVRALNEREILGSTGVGNGIALPHARIANLDHVAGVFIRLDKAVDFGAIDRQRVDLIFSLLVPESKSVEHLKALALVSRTMRYLPVCSKLRSNSDCATLHAILTEDQSSQAA